MKTVGVAVLPLLAAAQMDQGMPSDMGIPDVVMDLLKKSFN